MENNNRAKKRIRTILGVVLLIGFCYFLLWFFYLRHYVTTDNAYVMADSSYVSSRIPGTIEKVYVKNDDFVKQGDILVLLDTEIYKTKVNQLKEKIASLNEKIEASKISLDILDYNLDKNLKKAKNNVNIVMQKKQETLSEINALKFQKKAVEQDLLLTEKNYKRYSKLLKKHSISKEKFDEVETMYNKLKFQLRSIDYKLKVLNHTLKELDEQKKNAELGLHIAKKDQMKVLQAKKELNALIKERDFLKQSLKEAELNLSYCKIYAPIDGYVAGSKLQRGNRVIPGQVLMVIVPLDKVYVEANFKETQLKDVRIGQKVKIHADMYPDKEFTGYVEGIRAGTGQVFSLLPPENASGNWIKVVQRIPVKIVLEGYSYKDTPLRLGSSLEVSIDIRDKSGPYLRGIYGQHK